jgi:ribosomal protein S18 acetylase RimI-like enzyme
MNTIQECILESKMWQARVLGLLEDNLITTLMTNDSDKNIRTIEKGRGRLDILYETGNNPIGSIISIKETEGWYHLTGFYIVESSRKKGMGSYLFDNYLIDFSEKGIQMTFEVEMSNKKAVQFYENKQKEAGKLPVHNNFKLEVISGNILNKYSKARYKTKEDLSDNYVRWMNAKKSLGRICKVYGFKNKDDLYRFEKYGRFTRYIESLKLILNVFKDGRSRELIKHAGEIYAKRKYY